MKSRPYDVVTVMEGDWHQADSIERFFQGGYAMVRVTAAVLVDHGRLLIAKRKPTQKLAGSSNATEQPDQA